MPASPPHPTARPLRALWLALCLSPALPAIAQNGAGAPISGDSQAIVVIGSHPDDRAITRQVQEALETDPYLDASTITVSTHDGVVSLDGMVDDSWSLLQALRRAGRVAGVRRVEENLEMTNYGGEDEGL